MVHADQDPAHVGVGSRSSDGEVSTSVDPPAPENGPQRPSSSSQVSPPTPPSSVAPGGGSSPPTSASSPLLKIDTSPPRQPLTPDTSPQQIKRPADDLPSVEADDEGSPPARRMTHEEKLSPPRPNPESPPTLSAPLPPPLVRTGGSARPPNGVSKDYSRTDPLTSVTKRVATMANNATEAFDSGLQRLYHHRKPAQAGGGPPLRQPTTPVPVPASSGQPRSHMQPAPQSQLQYKPLQVSTSSSSSSSASNIQKPLRPYAVRMYGSPPEFRDSREVLKNLQRSPFRSPPAPGSAPQHSDLEGMARRDFSPRVRSLDELTGNRSIKLIPPHSERTRNGSSVLEVTREISDLVRFPRHQPQPPPAPAPPLRSLQPPPSQHPEIQRQIQLEAAIDDVERCRKEYERAYQVVLEAGERLQKAQKVFDHHQGLAAATAALQAERHHQEQQHLQQRRGEQASSASSAQPTLATLLLSDPPQKRLRLMQHQEPPPHPRTSRGGSEESPIDLSHAQPPPPPQRGIWGNSVEEVWKAASSHQQPPYQITILTPPDVGPPSHRNHPNSLGGAVRASQGSPTYPNSGSYLPSAARQSRHHKLLKPAYRPQVDPVSPPRPSGHSPSPTNPPEVIHLHSTADVAPAGERSRMLHPGGAILRPLPSPQPPPPSGNAPEVTLLSRGVTAPPRPKHSNAQCLMSRCKNPSGYVCSSCKLATYCSTECQTAHWPEHETECQRICHLTKNMMSGRAPHHLNNLTRTNLT